jgi:hypothetical protein
MRGQPGSFDIDDRLKRLSDLGDQLATFRSAVDFEAERPRHARDGAAGHNAKSKIRSRVERVFAEQKDRMGAIH